MPQLWKILKRSVADSYDYLGLILLCSMFGFTVLLAGYLAIAQCGIRSNPLAAWGMLGALYVLVGAPIVAGTCHVAGKIVRRDDPVPMDLFRGIAGYAFRAWGLGLIQLVVTAVILVSTVFYLKIGPLPVKLLGILFIYVLLFWLASVMFQFPLLVEQGTGIITAVKRSFLLTLGSPGFTAIVFFAIILLTCLSVLVMLPLPLIYIGLVSVLEIRALRALLIKYGILPPEVESSEEDPGFRIA